MAQGARELLVGTEICTWHRVVLVGAELSKVDGKHGEDAG